MSIAEGTKLGRYEIRSQLGAGGMGEVYLAQDTSELERTVAIKLLPPDVASDPKRMQRFVQEAKTVSALNHPNILTIHEFGQEGATRFIATEYVDGVTLREYLGRHRMKLHEVLDIAMQIAAALDAAHEANVVHRDIKPDNIMVRRRDHIVKVLDFGLAKPVEKIVAAQPGIDSEAGTKLLVNTEPGVVMGTVSYMSPEQSVGKTRVDHRTDIWSLGAVLYEMVTGRVPFEGKDVHRQIIAIQEQVPPSLARYAEGVPERLEDIVTKALAKDPNERYQTAKDLLIDLRNLKRKLEVDAEIDRTVPPEFRGAASTRSTNSGESTPATASGSVTVTATAPASVAPVASSAEYIVSGIKQHKLVAAIVVVVLVVGAIGLGMYLHARNAEVAIDSIAVMPFVNDSGSAELDYLSDGMTETLIGSLSQLPNLNVQARSSVFRYKGKDTDAKTIGKELNVQAILNGRVVQHGDDLVLYLELVDAQTGKRVWGDQYNRKQTDLVTLQSEIARDVSSKLKSKLSGAEVAKVEKNYTANPEAYQLYLKGRFYWNKRTGESLKQAVEFLNQAVEKDPNYALAYSGLAESYGLFPLYSVALPQESMPKAKAAAVRALEIDDSLAEAHTALAIYLANFSWNQSAAEKEFRRAIELNPNYPNAHHQFGTECLMAMGRFDEAIAEVKRAEELDPLSPIIGADLGNSFIRARRFDEAIAQLNRVLTLDPNFHITRSYLASAYHGKGLYAEAVAEYRKAAALNSNPWVKAQLARSLARSGQRDEAVKLLGELQSESAHRYVSSASLALVYGALGDKDKAFALLEKEVAERTPRPILFSVNPLWDDLRDDPRFADLIRRVEASKMD